MSLAPPLVLWCLKKDSNSYQTFMEAEGFTISVLGTEHESVSARLAKQGEHKLQDLELLETELGPPALADAHAVFECVREAIHDGGDHSILIGRVLRFARQDDGAAAGFTVAATAVNGRQKSKHRAERTKSRWSSPSATLPVRMQRLGRCHITFAKLSRLCSCPLEFIRWAERPATRGRIGVSRVRERVSS